MTTEDVKRKLTAILSADVKGYSRLMGEDEVATVRTLTEYRETMSTLIRQHRGRVVDSPGDNLLAEFASVVDAVQCAVEVQQVFKAKNADLPENRKMEFRIGVNLGDVIEEGERIYGDGVNIAARVEGLAEAGGICISGSAYEQIENKLALGYEYMGEQAVKNIAKPIRVYKVPMEPRDADSLVNKKKKIKKRLWQRAALVLVAVLILGGGVLAIWNFFLRPSRPPEEVASKENMAFPLPDKPSVVVLPFVNMSGDPEQEYFVDGMTEDLITDLSKVSGLFVIARNSSFTYKGKPVKIRQVAEDLGVRYVLEGSVRKAGDQMRINAQLIDTTTAHHLWAERYDSHIGDVFALQDKITQKIVSALAVKLTTVEQKPGAQRMTNNIEAYDAVLQGREHILRFTPEDLAKALSYFKKAVELDPNYSLAHAWLAYAYWKGSDLAWEQSLGVSWFDARMHARKSLQTALKNPTPLAHQVASDMILRQRLHDEAVTQAEKAIALDPNDPVGQVTMASALIYAGRPKEAIDFIKRAMRLDPRLPGLYSFYLGAANFCMGQLEESVTLIERGLKFTPEAHVMYSVLAAAYGNLGREQEARSALDSFMKRLPFPIDLRMLMYMFPFKDPEVTERIADGLLKAGLAGEPSGYYKISEKNRLTGEEIRELVFGRTVTGFDPLTGMQWWLDRTKEGKSNRRGSMMGSDSGKSWIEGDMICEQWQKSLLGVKYCAPVFRNPEGKSENKDEYIMIVDMGFFTWSPVD